MNKLLLISAFILASTNIFAGTNYREVGSFTSIDGTKITVGIDMKSTTKISLKGLTLYFNPSALYNFSTMLDINLEMVDTVVSNNIKVSYSAMTDRFNYGYHRTLLSYFSTSIDYGEDSCKIRIKYIEQTTKYNTSEFILHSSDVKELQTLISSAKTEGSNINNELSILNSKLNELKRY